MNCSPCQRTHALFQPGVVNPAIRCCFGVGTVCESCGRSKPTDKPRPKKGSFEDVFGHLGTPEEVATMWFEMQDKLERYERKPLKASEVADALWVTHRENADTYDLRIFDFAREIERRHGITPKQVSAEASKSCVDHHPV